jgi:hypothetical protein
MAFPINLTNAVDGVTEVVADHLNNLEAKVGIDGSLVTTSLDYLLKNTASVDPGHKHISLYKPDGSAAIVSVDASGKVGIGTTLPAQSLDLEKGHIRLGQVAAPTAPTVAVGAAGILTGNYYYRISFVTALGETETGASSALVAPSSQQVNLTNIPCSPDAAVIARKIYRTAAGGSNLLMKLVDTINDNTSTTYTDNLADGSLGVCEPRINSTGGLIYNGSALAAIIDNATTAIGISALKVNTGYFNSALGSNVLRSNTTGYNNAGLGINALYANTTGYYNSALGSYSLYANTTGYYGAALGASALRSNTTGYYNSALGSNALYANTTGFNNSAIGANAGRYIADGVSANTNSNNSLYLGYSAKALASGDTNEIVIGALAIGLGSNTVVLGNDAIITTALKGKVGIGTTAPDAAALLHLSSTTQGFLPPVMTTAEKTAISSPPAGLVVYDLTLNKLCVFTGTVWETITSS